MKSTNNAQPTQAVNEKAICVSQQRFAIAPTWQFHIVEDLSDEAQATVTGGYLDRSPKPGIPTQPSLYDDAFWASIPAC
jgi:hypothetical protein